MERETLVLVCGNCGRILEMSLIEEVDKQVDVVHEFVCRGCDSSVSVFWGKVGFREEKLNEHYRQNENNQGAYHVR